MIKFGDLSYYDLGIFWGVGSYTDGRMVFRHKDRYFIDRIGLYLNNINYEQVSSKSIIQYVLKTSQIDIKSFAENGWTSRNSDTRDLPILENYKDFLRAYIELHGCFKYTLRYKRKPKKDPYKKLAFIIYGNYKMLTSINQILSCISGVNLKTVQLLYNGKTASLNYASLSEINSILTILYDEPCNKVFWGSSFDNLKYPIRDI